MYLYPDACRDREQGARAVVRRGVQRGARSAQCTHHLHARSEAGRMGSGRMGSPPKVPSLLEAHPSPPHSPPRERPRRHLEVPPHRRHVECRDPVPVVSLGRSAVREQ